MIASPLIKQLESYLPLKEKVLVEDKFCIQKIKRKQKILLEGTVYKHYTFIVNGCFRMYGIDDRGYEHNIQFAAEGDWIADIGSFHTKKPVNFLLKL